MADPVVLSEEPETLKVNVLDPTKPKALVKTTAKLPPKQTGRDKVIKAFFGNDVNSSNLGEHIIKDYAEPTAKRMLNNAAQGVLKKFSDAIQVLLFGKIVNGINGPIDYTSFSNPNVVSQAPIAHKLSDQVEQFAFASREDALKVLEYLKGRIVAYGSASALDYYEACGEAPDYMMANRGWLDLSSATVRVAPEGFVLDMPRPIVLKRG